MSAKQSIVGGASVLAALVLFLVPSPSLAGHPGGGSGGHPGGSWGGGGGGGMSHYSGSWSGGSHYASPSFSHPGYSGAYGAMKPSLGTWNGASGLQFNHATPWTGWGSHSWDSAFQNHSWGNGWNSYYNHYNHYPWFGYGFGFGFWPWWGWGWDYGPAYWYYNPYGCVYPMDSSYWSYYSPYVDPETGVDTSEPVAAPQGVAPGTVQAGNPNEEGQGQGQESADAAQFYTEAHDAFTQGNYRDALRLGSHAAVESPQNGKVHELLSLALFASGDYRGAATEAHAALAVGAISDWENLFGYYGNADKYTEQLRALEKAVHDAPKSGPARFLLGYHYLMIGARDKAKDQLAEAVKLTPRDKLAAHFLKQLQSNVPLTPPVIPTPGTSGAGAGAGAGPGKPPVPGLPGHSL
jgi:hypothetical protein